MDRRCEKGHFYDPAKFSSCPHCGVAGLNIADTLPKSPSPQFGGDWRRDGETKPLMDKVVVGWLVCVEGPDRGRDYRIIAGRNFIGRSSDMHICISGDNSISRDRHAIITYDPKKNAFILAEGESSGLIYLNGDQVNSRAEISSYDRIQLGRSELMFVPFCGASFQWPAERLPAGRGNDKLISG